MGTDVTGRTRILPLAEAIGEVELVISETQDAYGRTAPDSDKRKAVARRMVALDMARQALADVKAAEDRRPR